MATKAESKAAVAAEKKEDYVQVFVPKERPDQGDAEVRINGKGWIVKRGVFVDVPKPVAKVLQHAQKMSEALYAYTEKAAEGGKIGEL